MKASIISGLLFFKRLPGIIIIMAPVLLWNCSGARKLPAGEYLFTGAEITLNSEDRIPGKSELKSQLEDLVTPEPNGSIFGMRPRVWIYNVTQDSTPNRGLKSWINRQIGEAPVLLSQVNQENIRSLMQNKLYNSGYFQAEVSYQTKRKKNKASVAYSAELSSPYRIDTVIFPDPENHLSSAIAGLKETSLIEKGQIYNVDRLQEERDRIGMEIRDMGYYYFVAEYLLFQVDSSKADRKVDIWLKIKDNTPPEALRQYYFDNIVINPDYNLTLDSARQTTDTLNIRGYSYLLNTDAFIPETITNSIFLTPDSLYSRTAHEQTLNRLMGLGVFQYANVRFREPKNSDRLDASIELTPMKKKSLRLELEGRTQTDYIGPNININFQNRNFMGGAELLELNANGGLETQFRGSRRGLATYEAGFESSLTIPRYVTPFFKIYNKSSYFVPRTRIEFAYQHRYRIRFFRLNSFSFKTGYIWNETRNKRHEFYPVNVSLFRISDTTAAFSRVRNENDFIRQSYTDQFILGTTYSFTYNNQREEDRTHNFYFNASADISGNLMQLVQSGMRKREPSPDDPYTIFNTPYSQYSRISTDIRHYYSIDRNHKIATRLFIGVGVPYGNSNTLPFVKQFFTGGTNSLRAFEARSVGPGVYIPEEARTADTFYDQLGDIKLEGNIEYRFPIYSIFKGALFVDAGNIWLINESESAPGGKFDFDSFIDQLAVGTGFGLRIDASFFVLRFDFGVPLRQPQGWVWKTQPVNNNLDLNDIVFNIGIGYPF